MFKKKEINPETGQNKFSEDVGATMQKLRFQNYLMKVEKSAFKIVELENEIAKHGEAIKEHTRAIGEHQLEMENIKENGIKEPIVPETVSYKIDKDTGRVLFFNQKGEFVGTTDDLIERKKGDKNGR